MGESFAALLAGMVEAMTEASRARTIGVNSVRALISRPKATLVPEMKP